MADSDLSVLLFAGRFEVRGSCAYTLRLAERSGEYGVRSRIVCSDASRVDAKLRAELPISENRHLGTPFVRWAALDVLRRELLANLPDLIHVQSRHVLKQGAWLARRLARPFILTVHGSMQPNERINFDQTWGRRIVAVSDSVKVELNGRPNIPGELVTVIRSGVKASCSAESLEVLGAGHVPVVGTASPLESTKGVPFFLGAAQKVLAAGKDVEFLVSGAGPEESNLRRLARSLGISEKVTFVPNLNDFAQSLAAMDIFCLPSLRQGLGTIMLEAMAMGKPVIASGVGGVYSIVRNNETGLMVPPSNSEQLAHRVLELLGDPAKARAIGERARSMVREQFGVEKMIQQTTELYRQVLSQDAPDS